MAFCPGTPKRESRNCQGWESRKVTITFCVDFRLGWGLKRSYSLVEIFPTACRTPPTRKGIGLIPDFPWSKVKLPV
jgi:hypothetical protein